MNGIFFLSIFLKGIGAVLEVVLQVFLIRQIGMEGYGTYTTWINGADLLFWILFSSLVKGNTFYLSEDGVSITKYRKKYYIYYVLPILLLISIGIVGVKKEISYILVLVITLLELFVLDKSSLLIAKRKASQSLLNQKKIPAVQSIFGELLSILKILIL